MNKWGGHCRICAVTSENTVACLNARIYAEKYRGVVSVNDEAHVADQLIPDVGKLSWVRDILRLVSTVARVFQRHRKLKVYLKRSCKCTSRK